MKKLLFFLLLAVVLMALLSSIALASDTVPSAAADGSGIAADVGDPDPGGLAVFVVMLTLAILIESLAEVVKAAISPAVLPKWVWFLITSIIGMVLCILFAIDMFAALGFAGGAAAVFIGQLLTGVAVGAGSGFVHTILGKLTAAKNADKAIADGQSLVINGVVEGTLAKEE